MKNEALSRLALNYKDNVPTFLPVGYRHLRQGEPDILTIYLHGYADHGGSFTRRLFPDGYPEELHQIAALIPNGPFPIPVKSDDGWREAYAWYFFDDSQQKMIISPETAQKAISTMIDDFGYIDTPKVIVGFSQGGFLAPYLAQHLKNVISVVGIGTHFLPDYFLPLKQRFKTRPTVHAIHGANDEVFPLEKTRAAHQAVLQLGFQGAFAAIEGGTHSVNNDMGKALQQLLLDTQAETRPR